ncbi:MAG: redoxin domain-containing protein [Gammaproteobacteria bacterium]|nr:redoxin domain-containing protein [Gammaproteobacteria bacterium]
MRLKLINAMNLYSKLMRGKLLFLTFFCVGIILPAAGFSPAGELKLSAPDISADQWINSEPLSWDALQNKVVIVEFWTFECYNCRNVEPYIKSWYEKYRQQGLEIVAVHSPEFERERDINNVQRYVKDHGITYPVAIDNDFEIWRRFSNRYWPAMYIVDKQGKLRHRFIGEGRYSRIEKTIEALLAENGGVK